MSYRAQGICIGLVIMFFWGADLHGAQDWNCSYVIKREGILVGTETFTVSISDGFNVLSGKIVLSSAESPKPNDSNDSPEIRRKFKYRSWPPFYAPYSAVVSVSDKAVNNSIVRVRIKDGNVIFEGDSKSFFSKDSLPLIFLDPVCSSTYSGLIQAYDLSKKGFQSFVAINPSGKSALLTRVDYRGEDTLAFSGEDLVRIFDVYQEEEKIAEIKANRFGKVLYVKNLSADFEAWLEGADSSETGAQLTLPEDVSTEIAGEGGTIQKGRKVVIGFGGRIIEGDFYVPTVDFDGTHSVILMRDFSDPESLKNEEGMVAAFLKAGCPVLALKPSVGFKGDLECIDSGIRWLEKREETAGLAHILAGHRLSAFSVWEFAYKAKKNKTDAIVLVDAPLVSSGQTILTSLEKELSKDGYTKEFGESVREKFHRFLFNLNTQSSGYRGVLKHSIDNVRGWSLDGLDEMVMNPLSFDGYVELSFPSGYKAAGVPLIAISENGDSALSVVKRRLKDLWSRLSNESVFTGSYSGDSNVSGLYKELYRNLKELGIGK